MLPAEIARANFLAELEGANAWAARRNLILASEADALTLKIELTQPETKEIFYLSGTFDQYKELPPVWNFCSSDWNLAEQHRFFPHPTPTPFGSSIFHSKPTICAPFNRLAYVEFSGPHNDWLLTGWMTAGGNGVVRANTIGDMLLVIYRDLQFSRGRMQ